LKINLIPLNKHYTKIAVFILMSAIIVACNTTKRVPKDKRLLNKNEIVIDSQKTNDEDVFNQLYQKPNSSILGYRLRLNLYNLAKKNSDSSYAHWLQKNPNTHQFLTKLLSEKQVTRLGKSFLVAGISNFLKKTGEAPVIYDTLSTKKSIRRLDSYFYNKGFFNVKTIASIDSINLKRVKVKYIIKKGKGFKLDSIATQIETPALDSLYNNFKKNSYLKTSNQYLTEDIDNERERITTDFRNNGAFDFQKNYITFDLDTLNTNKKINLKTIIKNQKISATDSSQTEPFKLYKISNVNIYTDNSSPKNIGIIKDSAFYKGFNLYSKEKLKYKPKAITNAVFIMPGKTFSDENSILTSKLLNNLRVFNYPTIQYKVDPEDENKLVANIFLSPRKKYTFGASIDFSHSNIQDFGISGNTTLGIRNVFNGAETFQLGFRGNIGSSRQLNNPNNNFFNISEIGIDAKLNFPKILFPIGTEKIIPKRMIPSTVLSMGYAKQRNIGLDKQNFTSSFTFNWTPTKFTTARFDLINIQFVKNLNTENYFNIYQSSYAILNNLGQTYSSNTNYFENGNLIIDSGTNGFINDVLTSNPSIIDNANDLKTFNSIIERRTRLTENNLIFASSFTFTKTSKKDIFDKEFYAIKTKFESAGNFLNIIANLSKKLKTQSGANTFFDVEYSQYLKGEFEYIKHWDLKHKRIFAIRSFSGIAIPYGNSKSIPFSRSYFAGGSNDNRAWQPYSLGPGSSGGINDFNEANLKLSFSAELRFNIFNSTNGAIFTDVGNIWNVFDNVETASFKFSGIQSLQEVAVGTGFGIRQDFGLFVVRLDLGFKTFNPANDENKKWFKDFKFSKSVINIGINYPF
jgi:outer membrane protein assembly factor BamA